MSLGFLRPQTPGAGAAGLAFAPTRCRVGVAVVLRAPAALRPDTMRPFS
jgi:hypothetical protein